MADNLYFTFKRGEIGKVLHFTLEDADGLFDLTGWTVTFALSLNGTSIFTGQSVVNANQTTNRGECSHTLNSTTANVVANTNGETYSGELKLTAGSNVFYWPVDKDNRRTYFKVEVQTPLS